MGTPAPAIPHIDLSIAQGSDKRFEFYAKDQNGAALDLAAYSEITFVIARSVSAASDLLSRTLTGGGIVAGAGGKYYLDVTDTESAALPPGVLYCEIQMVATNGDKQTVAAGHFRNDDTRIGE